MNVLQKYAIIYYSEICIIYDNDNHIFRQTVFTLRAGVRARAATLIYTDAMTTVDAWRTADDYWSIHTTGNQVCTA